MEPHEAASVLANPHHVLAQRDAERCAKLCECLKAFLLHRCKQFVAANLHQPVLEVYMVDGDPISTVRKIRRSLDSLVFRSGRKPGEFLMQILFLCNVAGELRVMFRDPQKIIN